MGGADLEPMLNMLSVRCPQSCKWCCGADSTMNVEFGDTWMGHDSLRQV